MSATKSKRGKSVDECIRGVIERIETEFIKPGLAQKYRRGYLDARRRLYRSIGEEPPRFKVDSAARLVNS